MQTPNPPPPVPAQVDTSSLTPAPPTAVPLKPRNAWWGFIADYLLAMIIMVAVTVGGMMVWGAWRAVQVAMADGGAKAADPKALEQAIGAPGPVMLLVVGSASMMLGALVVYLWRRRATPAERAQSRHAVARPRTWLEATGLGFGLFVSSFLLMSLLEYFGHTAEPSNLKMLEAAMAFGPWLLLLIAVVMAPLSEELLFRRVLFGRLWAAGKPVAGMIASSVLFALMHEIPGTTDAPWPMTLVLLLFYSVMGASFAWIYRRTGTLWAAIIAHATNNLLACLMLLAGYGS